MNIGFNLLHAQPEIGGGWNYIARLVATIGEYACNDSFIAFVTDKSACLLADQANIKPVHIAIHPENRIERVLFENTLLQPLARKHHVDCLHWFANTLPVMTLLPSVVTVYDLQPIKRIADYPWYKRAYLRAGFRQAIRRADVLLPMSTSTMQDLFELGISAGRMIVIPAIIPKTFTPRSLSVIDQVRSRYGLPHEFWLYVAHFYSHKNHLRLLEAFKWLKDNGLKPWQLVLRGDDAGFQASVVERINQLDLQEDVVLLPRLPEHELAAVYSAATALVFPSLYEGGGIPVMEAMACGCPVAAADIPTTREFAGDAAILFDPLSIVSIAEAMRVMQESAILREQKRQQALCVSQNHKPEEVCYNLIRAYHMAIEYRRHVSA